MPTIPIKPEPLEIMRARFPKCLEKVWVAVPEMKDRPGLHPEYIFDFEDGVRLLISKDKYPWGDIEIHVSASWDNLRYKDMIETTKDIQKRFNDLGGKGRLRFLGLSHSTEIKGNKINGIPHWIVDNKIN